MTELPDLSCLTHEEKDALIRALWAQVQALTAQVQTLAARVAELEARLGEPPKTPDNSSLPPSQGKKPSRPEKAKRHGPRPGSLGRMGGGRPLAENPDEIVAARPVRCAHCQAAFGEADHVLHGRHDKIDLPPVAPVVTRVEHYAGCCRCCGATTLAPVPASISPKREAFAAGSNQASPANSAVLFASVLVLCSSMAWSPPALERRKWFVEQTRDYATNLFPPHPRRHHAPSLLWPETH